MGRPRTTSLASETSIPDSTQELGSMYDYLAKVILLGPSGAGKSCILNRFLKNEWRVLTSQTIGVEFASKIIKVGPAARRKRIKLQLWDTAGTERFRSVSRSYYRGAAGAILIYDVSSRASFDALATFLMDARALASPNLTVLLAGNKQDLTVESPQNGPHAGMVDEGRYPPRPHSHGSTSTSTFLHDDPTPSPRAPETPSSISSKQSAFPLDPGGNASLQSLRSPSGTINSLATATLKQTMTTSADGRQVGTDQASRWASQSGIPVAVEVSALSGEGVEELFGRLARTILTKIELGEIDPDDPQSGIQYGDVGGWGGAGTAAGGGAGNGGDIGSIKSFEDDTVRRRWGRGKGRAGARRTPAGGGSWVGGMGEWGEVFRISGAGAAGGRRRRGSSNGRCC